MIQSGSTRLRFLRWKQRLAPLPLRVGEFFSFHTSECTPPSRVCKHALAHRQHSNLPTPCRVRLEPKNFTCMTYL